MCAMSRSILPLHVTVKDGERALLTRNGRFERVLEPGRHRLFDPARELVAEVFAIVRAEFPSDRYAVLKAAHPDLAATLFEAVETKAGELAVVSYDRRPAHLLRPGTTRAFWEVAPNIEPGRNELA